MFMLANKSKYILPPSQNECHKDYEQILALILGRGYYHIYKRFLSMKFPTDHVDYKLILDMILKPIIFSKSTNATDN